MAKLNEDPEIDGDHQNFPGDDDGKDYCFLKSVIMLMFRGKDNLLICHKFLFSSRRGMREVYWIPLFLPKFWAVIPLKAIPLT